MAPCNEFVSKKISHNIVNCINPVTWKKSPLHTTTRLSLCIC